MGRQLHLTEAALLLIISEDIIRCLVIIDTCLHLQTCHINQHYPRCWIYSKLKVSFSLTFAAYSQHQ